MAKNAATDQPKADSQRRYISQVDVPSFSLERAIRIPRAIGENYGYKPATPLQVAKALEVAPTTGGFKMLTGAAIAYGLTSGGYNAENISITPLGFRIVRPTAENDDVLAKREALLKPRVIREFLTKYDGAPVPKDTIAHNVLMEMGVPQERADDVFKLILEGAEAVGFLQTIKDRKYVELGNTRLQDGAGNGEKDESKTENVDTAMRNVAPTGQAPLPATSTALSSAPKDEHARKVFITHGKNKGFIEPIRELLAYGELEAVVAEDNQTVSQPVPDKVMGDMRACGSAIIHVEDERRLIDQSAKEHVVLNPNVLIEIGAAMALYGKRFILVVKEGVELPSNLQGLYQVRYKGDSLDGTATIRLLGAINDMKKRPLPA